MALYFKNKKAYASNRANERSCDHMWLWRNGQQSAITFLTHKVPFVVVEKNTHHLDQWFRDHESLIYVNG
jgi:hypothetical protein